MNSNFQQQLPSFYPLLWAAFPESPFLAYHHPIKSSLRSRAFGTIFLKALCEQLSKELFKLKDHRQNLNQLRNPFSVCRGDYRRLMPFRGWFWECFKPFCLIRKMFNPGKVGAKRFENGSCLGRLISALLSSFSTLQSVPFFSVVIRKSTWCVLKSGKHL